MAQIDDICRLGCIVCRCFYDIDTTDTPTEIHHLRADVGMGQRSNKVIPLCPTHHRLGGHGMAFHAGKVAFSERFGSEGELYEATQWLLEQTH